ncbi:MAG TPA: YbaB/EbfC family nucleoid-associated protein [Beijerinckiaceae bacterium]|nr:YbaB/EbfC family nucleoid-associated protein [Beijerinckiaceae bacterium]
MRDLMGIMKQAQAMQQKMQDVQAELDALEVEGSAGGGMVKVTMTAKGQGKSVRIDPSLLNPDEAEIVEDLVLAAMNDARGKAERAAQEKMEEVTKGLPLPPGLKLF